MSGSPKVFFANLRDMVERFDARYHSPSFAENIDRIKRGQWRSLGECCKISTETWDRAKLFPDRFPYIEISAINTDLGEITATEELSTAEAPSRAQMVVREGDILVSMTRPTRNAIARVPDVIGVAIASTGFAVLRSINEGLVSPDYFFHALRFGFCTMQFDQRSSGGNYPAITKDDLKKTIIPLPQLDVQKQIVSELNAAYAVKREADEKAARMLAAMDEVVFSELGIPPLPPQDTSIRARMFIVSGSELIESRLDAIAYQNLRREFLQYVEHSRYSCMPLAALVGVNRQQTNKLDGQQYIGLENINGTTGDFMPTQDKESCSSAVVFKAGDILFSKLRPYLNKVWLAIFDGIASTEFYPLHAKTEDAAYLTAYLRTKAVANVMTLLMTGNTLPRVQLEDILSLPVPVPPRFIQQRIVEKVMALREEAKRLNSTATQSLANVKTRIEDMIIG